MIKSFFLSFFMTLFVIFTVHNKIEYNRSFDNCVKYLEQIKAAEVYFEQNLAHKSF